MTVTVSDGVLTQSLYSLQEEFTSYTVSGKVQLCWTIEEPDTGTVYTLSLDGAPPSRALRRGQRLLGRRAGVSISFHITIDNTQHFGGKFP